MLYLYKIKMLIFLLYFFFIYFFLFYNQTPYISNEFQKKIASWANQGGIEEFTWEKDKSRAFYERQLARIFNKREI